MRSVSQEIDGMARQFTRGKKIADTGALFLVRHAYIELHALAARLLVTHQKPGEIRAYDS
jgi:hypothetical protein